MDHPISTRWGGRQHRYLAFPRAVSRCHDPYEGSHPVEFAKPIEYEAWLRWRFHPATLRITHSAQPLSAWTGRKTITATPTFVVTARDMTQTYHLVIPRPPARGHAGLRALASQTGARVVIAFGAELRRDMAMFWRLEFLRSASQLHAGEGEALDARIVALVRAGCATRCALHACLADADPQLVDARLGHLHCTGLLLLDLATDDFHVVLRREVVA